MTRRLSTFDTSSRVGDLRGKWTHRVESAVRSAFTWRSHRRALGHPGITRRLVGSSVRQFLALPLFPHCLNISFSQVRSYSHSRTLSAESTRRFESEHHLVSSHLVSGHLLSYLFVPHSRRSCAALQFATIPRDGGIHTQYSGLRACRSRLHSLVPCQPFAAITRLPARRHTVAVHPLAVPPWCSDLAFLLFSPLLSFFAFISRCHHRCRCRRRRRCVLRSDSRVLRLPRPLDSFCPAPDLERRSRS